MQWRKYRGEALQLPIQQAVAETLEREKAAGYKLKVCIGTDSIVRGTETEFATVIVFLRQGQGGFMYLSTDKSLIPLALKERMMLEVARSIDIAYQLCDTFLEAGVEMEVHADINTNPNYRSYEALREAMGYILGMGFTFRAKPDAFASSSCADRVIH
ncbi:MAG: hypothetical protein EOP52_03235 [Sphingobacteriales bacterium]|nr:MAG: hypothetical protein EOP52_03235 [Sphingobacteriales bacterium]